jgi:DNA repair photolyase
MSVPCVDEDVWRTLEPGTAHPLQRLRAVRELVDAGIDAGVLIGHRSSPASRQKPSLIERTIKAGADHGAKIWGCNVMQSRGRHTRSLHALARNGTPTPRRRLSEAIRRKVRAGRLSHGSEERRCAIKTRLMKTEKAS